MDLRDFHKKISAKHCFLNTRRKDLAKGAQVTGELPRNKKSVSVAFRMPLNNTPGVSECLVEARSLPQSPCRSRKRVSLPQLTFGNAMAAF